MMVFETVLVLLLGATILSAVAKRLGISYPALLAVAGAFVAFVPGAPRLNVPPDLILALFVAPVLLDAAYDTSLRDLRRNWLSVSSLVLVAVALTTAAVAIIARTMMPDMPWGAAIALGALVAPPDAVAALAVLRQVDPPHRMRVVLEGESLLNDASSLLIYRLAVGAVAAGSFSPVGAIPAFAAVFVGSVVAGWLAAKPVGLITGRISDAPSSVIFQFVMTFGVWLVAERLKLSGVVAIVVFGLTLARGGASTLPARLRVPSFAIWETVTVVLNVLAFTLIGLQLRPIMESLDVVDRYRYLSASLVILAVVIVVRIAWVMAHHGGAVVMKRLNTSCAANPSLTPPTIRDAAVVGWCGMRGVVTLAAAMGLPAEFPLRDFIQLTAFIVVLGTLLLQGLTLRAVLRLFGIPKDTTRKTELRVAREAALTAALAELDKDGTSASQRLHEEYSEALRLIQEDRHPGDTLDNVLRRRVADSARLAISHLRNAGTIGDDAYRSVEEELDRLELSAQASGVSD
jgi:monovalent cation/hydrogen antiporter